MARLIGLLIAIAGVAGLYFSQMLDSESWLKFSALSLSLGTTSVGLATAITRKNLVSNLSRIFVGIIFVYSGFAKVVDPLGTTYMIEDYFTALGLEALHPIAFTCSMILLVAELTTGIALLLNIWMKQTSWLLLAFMAFFTPFTLWVALKNPVQDCGCFGEALILTNWQTFWKNIIFFIPTIVVFKSRKQYAQIINSSFHVYVWMILAGICTAIGLRNYFHLPWIDFRPYHIGAYLPEKLTDGKEEVADYVFVYKNKQTGELKNFAQNEAGNIDAEKWEYADYKKVIIEEGHESSIHDFDIYNDHENITQDLLEKDQYWFLVIIYDAKKSDPENLESFKAIQKLAKEKNIRFLGITASLPEDVEGLVKPANFDIDFYNMDKIQLKTWVRSNPGLVLVKKGTIVGKWHHNDIPSQEEMKKILNL